MSAESARKLSGACRFPSRQRLPTPILAQCVIPVTTRRDPPHCAYAHRDATITTCRRYWPKNLRRKQCFAWGLDIQ
jgi:hypothetical protein